MMFGFHAKPVARTTGNCVARKHLLGRTHLGEALSTPGGTGPAEALLAPLRLWWIRRGIRLALVRYRWHCCGSAGRHQACGGLPTRGRPHHAADARVRARISPSPRTAGQSGPPMREGAAAHPRAPTSQGTSPAMSPDGPTASCRPGNRYSTAISRSTRTQSARLKWSASRRLKPRSSPTGTQQKPRRRASMRSHHTPPETRQDPGTSAKRHRHDHLSLNRHRPEPTPPVALNSRTRAATASRTSPDPTLPAGTDNSRAYSTPAAPDSRRSTRSWSATPGAAAKVAPPSSPESGNDTTAPASTAISEPAAQSHGLSPCST